jgi:hypothetical protein
MRPTAFAKVKRAAIAAFFLGVNVAGDVHAGGSTIRYDDDEARRLAFTILPKAEFNVDFRPRNSLARIPKRLRQSDDVRKKLGGLGRSGAAGITFTIAEQESVAYGDAKPLCMLQFGLAPHVRISSLTGLPGLMIKELIVLHESAHCLISQRIEEGLAAKKATGYLPADSHQWFPPSLLAVMESPLDTGWAARLAASPATEIGRWQESFCDVLAFITMAQGGADIGNVLEQVILFRVADARADAAHDSSGSLRRLQAFLTQVKLRPAQQAQLHSLSRSDLHALVLEIMRKDEIAGWPSQSGA